MGSIYVAEHVALGSRVALKIVASGLRGEQVALERFQREARLAARIAHEHVVSVFDLGVLPCGAHYYAMELLGGEDMAVTLARDGPLPWPRVRNIALQICDALAAAHARGILHRDLKPANVFRVRGRSDPDFVKLLDFGLVKLVGSRGDDLTGDGHFIGTLKFAPPEQLMGRPVDARIDIFSLGATLYRLLTGHVPYPGETRVQLLQAMRDRRLFPLEHWLPAAHLPDRLPELLACMLEPDRQRRIPDVAALVRAIRDVPDAVATAAPPPPADVPATADLVLSPSARRQRRTLPDGRTLFVHTTFLGTRDRRDEWSALSRIDGLLPAYLVLSHLGNGIKLTCSPLPGAGERAAFYTDANRRETRCEHIMLTDSTAPGAFDLGHRRSLVRRIAHAVGRRSAQALTAHLADLGVQLVAPPDLALFAALSVRDDLTNTQHVECICAHP